MTGLLTLIFDADDHPAVAHANSQDSTELDAHSALDPSIGLHLAESGRYGSLAGGDHRWSVENIAVHADINAADS